MPAGEPPTVLPGSRSTAPAQAVVNTPAPQAQAAPRLQLPDESVVLSTLRPGHPRLVLLAGDVERIKQGVASDSTARGYLAAVRRAGERTLTEPVSQRVLIGPRLLEVSRRVLERVYTLALLYRLDGAEQWLNRAREEMLAAAAFSDWNPSHFLDVAEMSHALAIGYDWLYDALGEGDRATIRQAIIEKGLRPAEGAYKGNVWWAQNAFNWNNVCNGGIATAALAVADEVPDLARFLVHRAVTGLPKALASYAPDGAWAEGPGYWGYATKYTVLAFAALEAALGTDFGLSTLPGLPEAGVFRLQGAGPTGLFFNFADAGERAGDEPSLFWLATRYESPLLAWGARDAASGRATVRDLLWYDARGTKDELARVGLDARYQAAHLAFFRSAWTDAKAIYVGFKGGDNRANHSHLDLGTFVLDALGQRWALDLGPDDYDLPGYFEMPSRPTSQRWTYYRLKTEGHNTLLIDGRNQDPLAEAPLVAYGSAPQVGYAVADLTAAYAPAGAKRVRRGVALLEGRSRVLVQDEIETAQPSEVVWAMHTRSDANINRERGDRAILALNGALLEARLLAPAGATFVFEPVNVPAPQRTTTGVKRLVVRLPEKVTSTRLAVLFTPVTPGSGAFAAGATPVPPSVTPLDQWPATR